MSRLLVLCFVFLAAVPTLRAAEGKPNFVIIFADDLGYGDLTCYGHPTIRTPHLDRMAREGIRFTQFYSAASVCTPSRAALLTGRLPVRTGMCSEKRRVLFPNSGGGIPAGEVTLAEGLREVGYKTGAFGKWHLGHLEQFLPTNNGFDTYFGIPYSNDMDRVNTRPKPKGKTGPTYRDWEVGDWNNPLLRDTRVIEQPTDQRTITKRYTQEAVKFIEANKEEPFFVYLPHSMPHVPLFRSDDFVGHSKRGLYGDVIEEIDWSVGRILDTLRKNKLDENTFVFFTSDNGPWLIFGDEGGSAGLLRDGKGCTYEGGMREPGIGWWPSKIPAGTVTTELGSTMDLFTTCLTLAGGKLPQDRHYDGVDLSPVLFGKGESPRQHVCYYRGTRLFAIRKGPWKAHFITKPAYGRGAEVAHDVPELYHLEHDPSEQYNVAATHPEIVAELTEFAEAHKKTVESVPSQLEIPLAKTGK